MMHTTQVRVDGVLYSIHHHSDWSGTAVINWKKGDDDGYHEIKLPARVLVACGNNAAIDKAIATLEELYMAP